MSHGNWGRPGVPHKGWVCVAVDDLGHPDHVCQMCQKELVRYVHTMAHPDYPDRLDVGCVCAAHMCEGYDAKRAAQAVKNRAKRREIWASGWKKSVRGNWYKRRDGRVFLAGQNRWTGRFWAGVDGDFLAGSYATLDAATAALFERENPIDPRLYRA